jgi:D-sedoheptulose 7-phosphate isomerase
LKAIKHSSIAAQPLRASREYLADLRGVLDRLDTAVVDRIAEAIWEGYEQGRTLFIFGNGGSAALASHFACDIGKGTGAPGRRRLRAISLTDNVPLMTAWANDASFGEIFAEQLRDLVEKDDLVLAISGSGNSENVVRGLQVARELGAKTMAFTGFSGGRVKALADLCLIVPSENMQHIEDAHLVSAHAIFTAIRQRMMHANGE